jgi:hypothetical protein
MRFNRAPVEAKLRAAAQWRFTEALSGAGGGDVRVLNACGMHRRAAAADAWGEEGAMARAEALAQLGEADAAWDLAAPVWARANEDARRRLALALGPWRPSEALEVLPSSARLEGWAIALHADRLEPGDRPTLRGSPDALALASALAVRAGDHVRARRAAQRLLRDSGSRLGIDGARTSALRIADFVGPPRSGRASARPVFSVIMSAHNAEATLATALASVQAQTVTDFECLVVDDASTDATAALAQALAVRDPRFCLLRRPACEGPYVCRNAALEVARGDYVAFLDADDVILPERMARSLSALRQRPTALAHVSRLVRLDPDGGFCAARVFPLIRMNPSSLVIRREPVLRRMGGFDPVRTGADGEYLGRLCVLFGADAVIRDKRLLTVASASPASLTGRADVGVSSRAGRQARIAYLEHWRERHLALALEGRASPS